MITLITWVACNVAPPTNEVPTVPTAEEPNDPSIRLPPTCDAGNDAWVQRVFPYVLGRKPHGAHEVQIWSRLADEQGRPAVIRALAESPEYADWWRIQISDMVYAQRSGNFTDLNCFDVPLLTSHDGSLTELLRTAGPTEERYSAEFNMADVILDSLAADNVAAIYQANLFARLNLTSANCATDPVAIETIIRGYHGNQLLQLYLDRNLACMSCHNSEYSVTDNPDPALDRAWGRGALFERALFGDSSGPADPVAYLAMNKGFGVVSSFYSFYANDNTTYDVQPWGMVAACGSFSDKPLNYDYLGAEDSYFGGSHGPGGSVFDLEPLFDEGVRAMEGTGVTFAADGDIDPAQAFAYLTAQNFVDQTWKLGFGGRLLLPYGMSRNQAQQERLQAATDHFVADGWSLTELLVDITADPYFNAGLPQTCITQDYGMKPVIDPYTVYSEGDLVNNGPGDLVHRQTGRTLLRSLYDSLGWGVPTEYPGFTASGIDETELQAALGVFLSDARPGFNGMDFQGALTWEGTFYSCASPTGSSSYLRELYQAALDADATVEDLALGLKDRLVSRALFEDDQERILIENILEVPLNLKVSEAETPVLGKSFGLLCGVLTQTPEFLMTVEPRPPGPIPRLAPRLAQDCEKFTEWTAAAGITATCE